MGVLVLVIVAVAVLVGNAVLLAVRDRVTVEVDVRVTDAVWVRVLVCGGVDDAVSEGEGTDVLVGVGGVQYSPTSVGLLRLVVSQTPSCPR